MHDVLVVCDDEEDIGFIENAFGAQPGNYLITPVPSASTLYNEYFPRAGTKLPCLIILNNYLPDIDSLVLLQKLKDNPVYKLIPIAIMAGFASQELIKEYYLAGANCFYKKPLDNQEWNHMADCLITLFCRS